MLEMTFKFITTFKIGFCVNKLNFCCEDGQAVRQAAWNVESLPLKLFKKTSQESFSRPNIGHPSLYSMLTML